MLYDYKRHNFLALFLLLLYSLPELTTAVERSVFSNLCLTEVAFSYHDVHRKLCCVDAEVH